MYIEKGSFYKNDLFKIACLLFKNCIVIIRATRQWLHFDWIFSLTPKGREQAKILKILHGFTERVS